MKFVRCASVEVPEVEMGYLFLSVVAEPPFHEADVSSVW